MFKARLPFYEMAGEIGSASESPSVAAEGQVPSGDGNAPTPDQTSAEPAIAPSDDVTKQQSFAARLKESTDKVLAEERTKWEKENAEKYKDYDTHKELSEYFQQINNADAMSLKERIEMERLQERADKENVPPEVLKRLDELEAKAAKVDELEQKQQQEQVTATYFSTLGEFVKDKGVSAEEVNKFMIENEMPYNPSDMTKSFNIALKAMRADALEKQVESAKKDGVKEFLAAKGSIPTVEGKSASGVVSKEPPKNFADAMSRAKQRLANWGNMEG